MPTKARSRKRTSGQLPKVPKKIKYCKSTQVAHLFLRYSANIHRADFLPDGQDDAIAAVRKIRASVGIDLQNPKVAETYRAIQFDVYRLFSRAPDEVMGLYNLLNAGKIDGSIYNGECACLVGSLVNLKLGVAPRGRRDNRTVLAAKGLGGSVYAPAESFTLAIHEGDTPLNSWPARQLRHWIQEWINSKSVLLPVMQAALEKQEELEQQIGY